MSISKQEVEHVAWLARLALDEDEKERFTEQLQVILEHAGRIAEVDTSAVEPMTHSLELVNVTRADETRECLSREAALSNAPEQEDGYFVVPKIV